MKQLKIIALFSGLFIQSAYAHPYHLKNTFNPATVQWSKAIGDAAVAGMGIYRLTDGTMQTCAGQMIYYYPYSSYVLEQLQAKMRGIKQIDNLNPQSAQYRFSVMCDKAGDFHLANLPAGKWIFVMNIPLVKNKADYSSYGQESDLSGTAGEGNGILYRIVKVQSNKINSVPLVQGDVDAH